eukprot:EG_transcript_29971
MNSDPLEAAYQLAAEILRPPEKAYKSSFTVHKEAGNVRLQAHAALRDLRLGVYGRIFRSSTSLAVVTIEVCHLQSDSLLTITRALFECFGPAVKIVNAVAVPYNPDDHAAGLRVIKHSSAASRLLSEAMISDKSPDDSEWMSEPTVSH